MKENPGSLVVAWVALLARCRYHFLFATSALLFALAPGLTGLQLSSDTRAFFSQDEPNYQHLRKIEGKYLRDESVLLQLRRADGSSVTDLATLTALLQLHEAAWQLPLVRRVDSLVNYKHTRGDENSLGVENLISPESLARNTPTSQTLQFLVSRDPSMRGRLIAKNGTAFGVNAIVELPGEAAIEVGQISSAARQLANQFESAHPEYRVDVAGMVPLMAVFAEAALIDLGSLIPLALLVSSVVVLMLLRSWQFGIALLIPVGCAMYLTVCLWSLLGHVYNTATVVAPVIVAVLVLAAGLHLTIAIRNSMCGDLSEAGDRAVRAIGEGVHQTLRPSLIALVTTGIGFAAFNAADAPPLRSLGNMSLSGIALGYLLIYSVLPAFLHVVGLPDARPTQSLRGFAGWLARWRAPCFVAACVVLVLCAAGLSRIRLNDTFGEYFDSSFSYRMSLNAVDEHLGAVNKLVIDLEHPANGDVIDPAYVASVAELQSWLARQRGVIYSVSFVDALKQVSYSIPERGGTMPDTKAGLAEYLLLYELSLDAGESLTDLISVDRRSSRLNLLLGWMSSAQIRNFSDKIESFLRQQNYFPESTQPNGLALLFASLSVDNVKSMSIASLFSTACIALIVGVLMGGMRLVFVCLLVSLAPLIAGFGTWGWAFQILGLPGAVIVALTIGIIVDDTVHFLHRYQHKREQGSATEALVAAVTSAGQAMLYTTVALVSGFLVLTASGFLINAQLGLFSALVFALALFFCFCLLPWLLSAAPTDGQL